MELIKPDYRGGILGVINAWRKELGLSVHHPADPQVSAWLAEHQWNQIVVLLIDGMGSRLLETKLEKDSFLRTHQLKEVTTVYPSTTSAATTSVLSGKSPAENGWIGWHQYFKELDDSLILFMNRSYYGERSYPEYSYTHIPFLNQKDELTRMGKTALELYPAFREGGAHSFDELCGQIATHSQAQDAQFIYAYWDHFDSLMHVKGPSDPACAEELKQIDERCRRLASQLDPRTGLIIIADHGQVDVDNINLREEPELLDCLRFGPTVEPRGTAFFVKDGRLAEFTEKFERKYAGRFLLKPSQTWLDEGLFGPGPIHPRTREFLGDVFAVAIGSSCLGLWENGKPPFKGQHAGLGVEEMMIPVILAARETEDSDALV